MISPTFARPLAALLAVFMAACTTSRVRLSYTELAAGLPVKSGPSQGEILGYVTGESGGFAWSFCDNRVRMSLEELVKNAKALGADELGDVIWDATGTSDPGCRRSWVFMVLWPMALTRMFMNTRVEAVAYKKRTSARKAASEEERAIGRAGDSSAPRSSPPASP